MKIPITHWGYVDVEGVRFFVEPETYKEMDKKIIPFEMIHPNRHCPHVNLNESNYIEHPYKYVYLDDDSLSVKKCLNIIPEGVMLADRNYTFIHAKYSPGPGVLIKYLNLTNAIPLFIYGIDCNVNLSRLFSLTRMDCPRPLFFSGSSDVPIPSYIKRIKEK